MGGNSSTNTVTKQDNTPWAPAQAPLQDIYGQAATAYGATPKTSYDGSYIAPQSPSTILAQQFGSQLATNNMNMGAPVANDANSLYDSLNKQLSGAMTTATTGKGLGTAEDYANYVNGSSQNNVLRDSITAALHPLQTNLQQTIIPQAKLNAVGSGVYGGDANDQAMSKAINDNYTSKAADTASSMTYQAANDYFNRALAGVQAAPSIAGAQDQALTSKASQLQSGYMLNALPIDTLSQIGQQQDTYNQTNIKALYQQWLDQLNAPWQGLDQYRTAISGYPSSSSGTSTGTTTGGGMF